MDGWWRASYGGAPWVGTPSSGGSGGQNLTQATVAPTVGAALNTLGTASFNGVDNRLDGAALTTFMTAGAYSGFALVYVNSIGTNSATPSVNEHIACTSGTGQWGIFLRSNGTVGHRAYNGTDLLVSTAFTVATWQLVQWRMDGLIYIRVNSAAWASAPGGAVNSIAANLDIGRNPNQDEWLDGRIAEVGLDQSVWSDAEFDAVKDYLNYRYALAL